MNHIRLVSIQIQALPRSMRHHWWKEINNIIWKTTNKNKNQGGQIPTKESYWIKG